MRCKSANESAWVRIWDIIHPANDGLVRLNGSVRSTKWGEVLL